MVARDVPSRDAWFTTTKEAQKVEDELAALETADQRTREAGLPEIDRRLLDLEVDQETFEVLYRRRLQLAVPADQDVRSEGEPRPAGEPRQLSVGSIVGIALAALSAADLILTAVLSRRDAKRDRFRI
jgi:hypothetical protein